MSHCVTEHGDGACDHPDDHDHDGHDHDDHDHDGHEHRGGLRGAIAEVFRSHSHDAADSLDTALEANRQGIRAVKISFVALLATSLIQVVIIVATGSVALLADTIHNFSDALTAIPLFLAFKLSRRPANRRYTYGYGRAEDLAGVFVITMITLSSIIAAYEAIQRLIHPRDIHNLGWLIAAGVTGFVGNELVALYRIRVGQQIGSAALAADGYHARTDGFTSLAVALGAFGASLGFQRADPIVGLAISVAIFAVLRGAAKQVFRRLMDAVDPEIVEHIEHLATAAPGVHHVDDVRVRWQGHRLTASLAIGVDSTLTVSDGHAVAEAVRHELLHHVRHLDTVDIHVDPAGSTTDPHPATAHHP